MSRPRLLFLDQYGGIGGGQTVLLSLLAAARGLGEVMVLAPPGELQAAIRHQEPDVTYQPCAEPLLSHGTKSPRDIAALMVAMAGLIWHLSLLRRQDVIYVNGLRHLPAMLLLSPLLKARIIYHVHLDHSSIEKRLIRAAARRRATHAVVTNSRFVQNRLSAAKSVLIENALDRRFAGLPFRDRFARPLSRVAVCGTLRPEKGQDVAVAAIRNHSDLALYIIGRDGDGVADWIAALRAGAPANVIFDGAVSDLAARLDTLGIQVNLVPSQWDEPFGLAAIEGMACSCLTIVSGTGGLADIAAKTGALVAADASALSALLGRLKAQTSQTLAAQVRAQYGATQTVYASAGFERKIAALLSAAIAAPPARHCNSQTQILL